MKQTQNHKYDLPETQDALISLTDSRRLPDTIEVADRNISF